MCFFLCVWSRDRIHGAAYGRGAGLSVRLRAVLHALLHRRQGRRVSDKIFSRHVIIHTHFITPSFLE